MKILEKRTYQTYAAIIAYEYTIEHEGEKYLVIHNVTDEGEESFYAYNLDGYKNLELRGGIAYLKLKERLIQHVKNINVEC